MFQVDMRTVCVQIVKHELKRNKEEGKALHINFDLGLSYFESPNFRASIRKGLHLLYYVKPGYNYITVFSGMTASPFGRITEVAEWKHEATHDSEWRSVAMFNGLYFDMADEINGIRTKLGLETVAPALMHENHSFRTEGICECVNVEVTKDPTDEYEYRKVVKLL